MIVQRRSAIAQAEKTASTLLQRCKGKLLVARKARTHLAGSRRVWSANMKVCSPMTKAGHQRIFVSCACKDGARRLRLDSRVCEIMNSERDRR